VSNKANCIKATLAAVLCVCATAYAVDQRTLDAWIDRTERN
jgi:hypothetical protein